MGKNGGRYADSYAEGGRNVLGRIEEGMWKGEGRYAEKVRKICGRWRKLCGKGG